MSSLKKRKNGVWRARYRDEAGKEHARHFPTKKKGKDWLDQVTESVVTGTYVDPDAGRMTFAHYFEDFLRLKVYEDTSRRAAVLAASGVSFRDVPMGKITHRHERSWVTEMHNRGLAPARSAHGSGMSAACSARRSTIGSWRRTPQRGCRSRRLPAGKPP